MTRKHSTIYFHWIVQLRCSVIWFVCVHLRVFRLNKLDSRHFFFFFYSFFIVDKVFTQFTISYYLQLERKTIRNGLYSSIAVITIEMLFHFYYSQEIHFYLCTYLLICWLPSFFLSLLTYHSSHI